ncbi:hypothetical protein NW066_03385 [Mycoplasmopsis felis]|nr:hypothetical protein [Mycoplasmopsis felis]UWV85740.1 hypothetical protein NW066_03385 [Mycoplasmopsis felis]
MISRGKPAVISKVKGIVISIEQIKTKDGQTSDNIEVKVKKEVSNSEDTTIETYQGKLSQKQRVKIGDNVIPGQKIFRRIYYLKWIIRNSWC